MIEDVSKITDLQYHTLIDSIHEEEKAAYEALSAYSGSFLETLGGVTYEDIEWHNPRHSMADYLKFRFGTNYIGSSEYSIQCDRKGATLIKNSGKKRISVRRTWLEIYDMLCCIAFKKLGERQPKENEDG